MGADITLVDNTAVVRGVEKLSGAQVQSTDLRGGATLVVAGLAAEGRTEVTKIEYIDRGYEDFVGKLRSLGAQVVRLEGSAPERKRATA
jgi:UDP-N-acetylglucosamine 1-carboxyvinyltransferase